MYVEKMEKFKRNVSNYRRKIRNIDDLAGEIEEDYYKELIGEEKYDEIKKELDLFFRLTSSKDSVAKQYEELYSMIGELFRNIRSSKTKTNIELSNGKELLLYSAGFGVESIWSHRSEIVSPKRYFEIFSHGKIRDYIWKQNKKEMFDVFHNRLKDWKQFNYDNYNIVNNQSNSSEIKKPKYDGNLIELEKEGIEKIEIVYWDKYWHESSIQLKKGYYNTMRMKESKPKYVYILSQIWDEYLADEFKENNQKLLNIVENNNEVLKNIKSEIIPFLTSELM
jgi:hypothetical protein